MTVKVSFHQVDHSDALESFVVKKSSQLKRFLNDSEQLNWVIDFKDKLFKPNLNMSLNGQMVSVNSKAQDAFIAVNEVFSKAKNLLRKRHGRRVNHH